MREAMPAVAGAEGAAFKVHSSPMTDGLPFRPLARDCRFLPFLSSDGVSVDFVQHPKRAGGISEQQIRVRNGGGTRCGRRRHRRCVLGMRNVAGSEGTNVLYLCGESLRLVLRWRAWWRYVLE